MQNRFDIFGSTNFDSTSCDLFFDEKQYNELACNNFADFKSFIDKILKDFLSFFLLASIQQQSAVSLFFILR